MANCGVDACSNVVHAINQVADVFISQFAEKKTKFHASLHEARGVWESMDAGRQARWQMRIK